jgi:hypothetical protein
MSHTIELPDALPAALLEAADASGLTPVNWLAVHLRQVHEKRDENCTSHQCQDASGPLRGPGRTHPEWQQETVA